MATDTSSAPVTVPASSGQGASSKTKSSGRLLRKPRAPAPIPPPVPSPPPRSYTSETNPEYAYYMHGKSGVPSRKSAASDALSYQDFEELASQTTSMTRKSLRYSVRKQDLKYVLDPDFRERTALGTYVEGQTLVRPYRTRGPHPLPARCPKRNPQVLAVFFDEDMDRYYQTPEFTLEDFLIQVSEREKTSLEVVQDVMLSKHNYKKLQKLITERGRPAQKEVKMVEMQLSDDIPKVIPRVPEKQFLIELTALYKEQLLLSNDLQTDSIRTAIRPLPKYSPDYKPDGPAPHTEIIVYEDPEREQQALLQKLLREDSELPGKENIFRSATSRYFQGGPRSNSPFAVADEGVISPSELAILDSLMAGGKALSLKAHFISQLPDIEPLAKTITYLNLSFNDFRIVPYAVFEISQLTVLKLRDNPITEIQPEISQLKHLRTLVFSFCLVTTLPRSLFTLKKLEHLDFAYNKVSFVPNEIKKLKKLRELNMEGNQLCAMPVGALKLRHLKHLRVKNNFMHPLFWKENSKNEPQRLTDMAALCFKQYQLDKLFTTLPEHIAKIIDNYSKCDCCRGPLYGIGLRVIRPVSSIFGIRNLPFLFHCCSPYCTRTFLSNSESLVDVLYGDGTKQTDGGAEQETTKQTVSE